MARFSTPAVAAFELLFRPWMRRRVDAVRVAGVPASLAGVTRPVLLAANHVSWWDPFALREAQRAIRPRAPMYTLMSEVELARFPFFPALGVVGIDAASPASIRRALRTLETLLRDRPDGFVALFPQGRIWPSHRRPLGFRRGIELFARHLDPIVLPVGIHVEPMARPRPTVFVSIGEPADGSDAAGVERRVEAELDAILGFLANHGEDAVRGWPHPGQRLREGPVPAGL